jgi:uncharacterized delta-60 repeat protein
VFGLERGRIGLVLATAFVGMALTSPPVDAKPGEPDRSFGQSGKVIGLDWLTSGGDSELPKVVVARDGGIFGAAVGAAEYVPNDGPQPSLLLRHYLPSGQLDTSFGAGGTVRLRRPAGLDLTFDFSDLAVDDQGRPLLFGTAFVPAETEFAQYPSVRNLAPSLAAVVRLLPDGRLDPSFGEGNGVSLLDFAAALPPVGGRPHVHAASGAIDPRGRIMLIASQTEDGTDGPRPHVVQNDRLVARLTPTGALDSGFGEGDGIAPLGRLSPVIDMAFGRRGQITLGGPANEGATLLLRLDASGQPASGFGVDGLRAYRSGLELAALEVDRYGRTLLLGSGSARRKAGWPQRVMRLRPGGMVDHSFGQNGRVTVRVPARSRLTGIVSDRKGRVLLSGTIVLPALSANRHDPLRAMGALRLRASGKPDPSFGREGSAITRFGSGIESEATQLAFDGRGGLLVAGFAQWPNRPWPERSQVLARYRLR